MGGRTGLVATFIYLYLTFSKSLIMTSLVVKQAGGELTSKQSRMRRIRWTFASGHSFPFWQCAVCLVKNSARSSKIQQETSSDLARRCSCSRWVKLSRSVIWFLCAHFPCSEVGLGPCLALLPLGRSWFQSAFGCLFMLLSTAHPYKYDIWYKPYIQHLPSSKTVICWSVILLYLGS